MADSTIQTQPGFEGTLCTWYFYDSVNKTLTTSVPTAKLAAGPDAKLTFRPLYLNAPPTATGTTDATKFGQNSKPTAYLKVQITQKAATNSSTWSAMYPVIDNPNDDIGPFVIFDNPVSSDPIQNVPIPGGKASLRIPLTAVVGGPKQSSLANIIKSVIGIGTSTAGKALFPIPAVDVSLAQNVEDLLNLASTAFARATYQQFWIAPGQIDVALTTGAATGAPNEVAIPQGTSVMVAFPTMPDNSGLTTVTQFLQQNRQLILDANNRLATADGQPAFSNSIYATFHADVG